MDMSTPKCLISGEVGIGRGLEALEEINKWVRGSEFWGEVENVL